MVSWRQIQPHSSDGGFTADASRPCGRDIWGNSFAYGGALYLFGGAWERYGASQHWRDHGKLGVGNDLWRFDVAARAWSLLEEDDASLDFGPKVTRPGARLLASVSVVGDWAYLFGGLAVLERGFVLRAVNDLWRYHIPDGRWELLHPDTGWANFANAPTHPPIRGAHGAAVLGTDIYVFGGWPGTVPTFTVNDLWRYDTLAGAWEQRSPWRSRQSGAGYGAAAQYPGARYCANLFACDGALYLFSGRDTGERNPEFFSDLWRYDPVADRWELLHPDDESTSFIAGAAAPAGRYGSGHAAMGERLYLFGGHNGIDTVTERNDFWAYTVTTRKWEQIHADEGTAAYGRGLTYPGVRRVAAMEAVGGSLLLFGGMNCFMGTRQAGYSLPLNDLWECRLGNETSLGPLPRR